MRRRAQTAERGRSADAALWREAMRDVTPLRRGQAPAAPAPPRPEPAPPVAAAPRGPAPPPRRCFAGLDRATAERLKRGQHPIEARLDLHGMTQAEAHRALRGFVERSRTAGRRCVLVITGRGRLGSGILKEAVPRWLDGPDLQEQLLGIAPAQPRDGGSGALYLLLRRIRPAASR